MASTLLSSSVCSDFYPVSCFQAWGSEIKYKKVALLPNLSIENFALETPQGRTTPRRWREITFTVDSFSFEEYCQEHFPDFLD